MIARGRNVFLPHLGRIGAFTQTGCRFLTILDAISKALTGKPRLLSTQRAIPFGPPVRGWSEVSLTLRVVSLLWHQPTYDPGMSDRKTRLTVTVDPYLAAYAEQLVKAGKAPSVSAVFNDALAERVERDKRIRRRWKEAAERADPEKVDRMIAHVQARAAVLPGR